MSSNMQRLVPNLWTSNLWQALELSHALPQETNDGPVVEAGPRNVRAASAKFSNATSAKPAPVKVVVTCQLQRAKAFRTKLSPCTSTNLCRNALAMEVMSCTFHAMSIAIPTLPPSPRPTPVKPICDPPGPLQSPCQLLLLILFETEVLCQGHGAGSLGHMERPWV